MSCIVGLVLLLACSLRANMIVMPWAMHVAVPPDHLLRVRP